MNKPRLLARWEKGRRWVELYENRKCYFVKYGTGYQHLGLALASDKLIETDEEALAYVQHYVDTNLYLPMFAKIPMKRVV